MIPVIKERTRFHVTKISVWKKNTGLLLWSSGEMWETMNFWWGKSGPAALLAAGPLLGALPISPALNSLSSSHWKDRVIISLCPFTVHIVSKVCPWWWSYCIGVMAGARWSGRQDMPCSLVPSSCQEGRQKNGNIIQIAGGVRKRDLGRYVLKHRYKFLLRLILNDKACWY